MVFFPDFQYGFRSSRSTADFLMYLKGPSLFLLYVNDLPDDVICNIGGYADDTTLYSKCDQASDLWH